MNNYLKRYTPQIYLPMENDIPRKDTQQPLKTPPSKPKRQPGPTFPIPDILS